MAKILSVINIVSYGFSANSVRSMATTSPSSSGHVLLGETAFYYNNNFKLNVTGYKIIVQCSKLTTAYSLDKI